MLREIASQDAHRRYMAMALLNTALNRPCGSRSAHKAMKARVLFSARRR
jgi:hypothetical protein